MDELKKFYHGTSTYYHITDTISPFNKSDNVKTLWKRKSAKIFVTDDLDAAKYYANKAASEKGGDPIIYEVEPDTYTMVKINRTDYSTANARVVKIINV